MRNLTHQGGTPDPLGLGLLQSAIFGVPIGLHSTNQWIMNQLSIFVQAKTIVQ
ncbi:MAG: hypothetical protein H0X31_22075 [Nostocaceae cyanobacterium]|nr:hypothetical protein [Nostocaceae cyanobacterium]